MKIANSNRSWFLLSFISFAIINGLNNDEIQIESSMAEELATPIRRLPRAYILGTCTCTSSAFSANLANTIVLSTTTTSTIGNDGVTTYTSTRYTYANGSRVCSQACASVITTCGTTCAIVTTLQATYFTGFTYVRSYTDEGATDRYTLIGVFGKQVNPSSSTYGTSSTIFDVGCATACDTTTTTVKTTSISSTITSTVTETPASCSSSTTSAIVYPIIAAGAAAAAVAISAVRLIRANEIIEHPFETTDNNFSNISVLLNDFQFDNNFN